MSYFLNMELQLIQLILITRQELEHTKQVQMELLGPMQQVLLHTEYIQQRDL